MRQTFTILVASLTLKKRGSTFITRLSASSFAHRRSFSRRVDWKNHPAPRPGRELNLPRTRQMTTSARDRLRNLFGNTEPPFFTTNASHFAGTDHSSSSVPKLVSFSSNEISAEEMDDEQKRKEERQEAKDRKREFKKEMRRLKTIRTADQLKRTLRYFGLRPPARELETVSCQPILKRSQRFEQSGITDDDLTTRPLDLSKPAPYPFESKSVIISIDVESWEEDHRIITEVGISTLDTLDIVEVAPGPEAESWSRQIRSRHLRIIEYQHYVNWKYCRGNPESFAFGTTEWVTLENAASTVDNCFAWPYPTQIQDSACFNEDQHISDNPDDQEHQTQQQQNSRNRNLLLLGHSVGGDIAYLSGLGSRIFTQDPDMKQILQHTAGCNTEEAMQSAKPMSTIQASFLESLDAATLYQSLHNETQVRSLVKICDALGVPARHAHNAGNDARYTLEAFLKIIIKAANEGQSQPDVQL